MEGWSTFELKLTLFSRRESAYAVGEQRSWMCLYPLGPGKAVSYADTRRGFRDLPIVAGAADAPAFAFGTRQARWKAGTTKWSIVRASTPRTLTLHNQLFGRFVLRGTTCHDHHSGS